MVIKEYRKKPVVVEAFQVNALDSNTVIQIEKWVSNPYVEVGVYSSKGDFVDFSNPYFDDLASHIEIISKLGDLILKIFVGDYVVKGIDGSVYPVKEDTFKETYEDVSENKIFSRAIVW